LHLRGCQSARRIDPHISSDSRAGTGQLSRIGPKRVALLTDEDDLRLQGG
jgi:hypothetical protein